MDIKEITLQNIGYRVGPRLLFHDVSFKASAGEVVGLIGPSGCGKTTLLNIIGRLIDPSSGSISFDGRDATRMTDGSRRKLWKNDCAFIYQDYGIIEDETVEFNITLTHQPWKFQVSAKKRENQDKRINEILRMVHLEGRLRDKAAVLSGGEKQRLGIARALWKRAEIIFADEPTASLDAANRGLVTDLLVDHVRRGGIVFIATHDDRLMSRCDYCYDVSKSG